MKGLKTEHYNTALCICNHCTAILKVTKVDLMNAETWKIKFRNRIGWVSNDSGGSSYLTVNVEILHKNYREEYSPSSIFLNPTLIGVSIHFAIDSPNTHDLLE